MAYTILLYGATGFSGRLIAAEAERAGMGSADDDGAFRMILAGRNEAALSKLAAERHMEHRTFGLEDPDDVVNGLTDVDVVVNAAGPFESTAHHLAKAAVLTNCHYVDINGEMHVYRKLEELGLKLQWRNVAFVCGAGHSGAASNLLLYSALDALRPPVGAAPDPLELGAIRIALSRIVCLSRGSFLTLLECLREQVAVIRMAVESGRKRLVLWHVPVGQLERGFDFRDDRPVDGNPMPQQPSGERITSAANLVDTLEARLTVTRKNFLAHRIESYVEVGTLERLAAQVGAFLAPVAALPLAREIAQLPIEALVPDPTPLDLARETHTLVLDVEDRFQTRVIEWCWHTPNPYQFTAQVVVEIARQVAVQTAKSDQLRGWVTPSEVLRPTKDILTSSEGFLRGCRLEERRTLVTEPAS